MNNPKPKLRKEVANLRLLTICKQILATKWYEIFKRAKLFNNAKAFAKENNI